MAQKDLEKVVDISKVLWTMVFIYQEKTILSLPIIEVFKCNCTSLRARSEARLRKYRLYKTLSFEVERYRACGVSTPLRICKIGHGNGLWFAETTSLDRGAIYYPYPCANRFSGNSGPTTAMLRQVSLSSQHLVSMPTIFAGNVD